jgi:hypothetical protein
MWEIIAWSTEPLPSFGHHASAAQVCVLPMPPCAWLLLKSSIISISFITVLYAADAATWLYLQVYGVHCSTRPHSLCHEERVVAVATGGVHCHVTRLQHLQAAAQACSPEPSK